MNYSSDRSVYFAAKQVGFYFFFQNMRIAWRIVRSGFFWIIMLAGTAAEIWMKSGY